MNAYDMALALPSIDVLRGRCQALAVLERVVGGDGAFYSYTRAWGAGEAAFMDSGSGDEWAIVFTGGGAFVRVFDHESPMTPYRDPDHELWPGLLDGLPAVFAPQIAEPAFGDDEGRFIATAVLWRLAGDDRWHAGRSIDFPGPRGPYDQAGPDGTSMLEILAGDVADRYVRFAADYYEVDVDRAAVEHILGRRPLTDAVVHALNPETTVAELREDVLAIGY